MKASIVLLLSVMALFSGCGERQGKPLSPEQEGVWLHLGDSISTAAQHTLLQYVTQAVQHGGFEHAVDFCNTKAIPITDSVANQYAVHIQRLSDKNRNPDNAIRSDADWMAWTKIQEKSELTSEQPAHFVQDDGRGNIHYYKPIFIGMPTCLKCHGHQTQDIASGTLHVIREWYPEDKAVAYAMGDLRGMWKIKLTTNQ